MIKGDIANRRVLRDSPRAANPELAVEVPMSLGVPYNRRCLNGEGPIIYIVRKREFDLISFS
jgi:hypothetical protein